MFANKGGNYLNDLQLNKNNGIGSALKSADKFTKPQDVKHDYFKKNVNNELQFDYAIILTQ